MAIIGIGLDMVELSRMERSLRRFGIGARKRAGRQRVKGSEHLAGA